MRRGLNINFIYSFSEEWVESMYNQWMLNPELVDDSWQPFFAGFDFVKDTTDSESHVDQIDDAVALKLSGVQSLLYRYRSIGHLQACTDPLSPCLLEHPLLALSNFDLDSSDLDVTFTSRRYLKQKATLREILSTLQETYCRDIGVEFMHIQDPGERQWLIDRMEPCRNRPLVSENERVHLLAEAGHQLDWIYADTHTGDHKGKESLGKNFAGEFASMIDADKVQYEVFNVVGGGESPWAA